MYEGTRRKGRERKRGNCAGFSWQEEGWQGRKQALVSLIYFFFVWGQHIHIAGGGTYIIIG